MDSKVSKKNTVHIAIQNVQHKSIYTHPHANLVGFQQKLKRSTKEWNQNLFWFTKSEPE